MGHQLDVGRGVAGKSNRYTPPASLSRVVGFFFGARNRWASIAVGSLLAVVVFAALVDLIVPGEVFASPFAKNCFLGLLALLVSTIILYFRDDAEFLATGPQVRFSSLGLVLLTGLTAFIVADQTFGWNRLTTSSANTQNLVLYLVCLASVMASLAVNAGEIGRFQDQAINQARRRPAYQANLQNQPAPRAPGIGQRNDENDAFGALVGTLFAFALAGLALVAGQASESAAERPIHPLFGIVPVAIVVALCAFVGAHSFLIDTPIARWMERLRPAVGRRFHWLAAFYRMVDEVFVRIGANVVGMGHRSMWSRYAIMTGLLGNLAVQGFCLEAPFGLVPLGLGFLLALSVWRVWNWVEEDRALAAITNYNPLARYKTDSAQDYLDETMLAFVFVFLLMPIALYQTHVGVFDGKLFTVANPNWLDWMAFFGFELAKALPLVDWAEIYLRPTPRDAAVSAFSTEAKHTLFMARLLIDLILIAALLQGFKIASRNRQQKRLFAERTINQLDVFVERVELRRILSMRRARDPKIDSANSPSITPKEIEQFNLVDFRQYNRDRLTDLYLNPPFRPDEARAFIDLIATEGGFSLETAVRRTVKIAEDNGNSIELVTAFQKAQEDHTKGVQLVDLDDLRDVFDAIRTRQGLAELKLRMMDFMLENELGTVESRIELLRFVALHDKFLRVADYAAYRIDSIASQASSSDVLNEVRRELVGSVERRNRAAFETAVQAIDERLREFRSQVDRQTADEVERAVEPV